MIRMLAKDIAGDFNVEPFFTVTLQAGHGAGRAAARQLELGNIAAADISQADPGSVDP